MHRQNHLKVIKLVKNSVKLYEKQLYIKSKNILNKELLRKVGSLKIVCGV